MPAKRTTKRRATHEARKKNGLTDKQREFAMLYVKYGNAGKAYREAYGKNGEVKDSTCYSNASKLLNNAKVLIEVDRIREEVEKEGLLTITEKRKFLADVVKTSIGEIDEHSPLCQRYEESSTADGHREVFVMPSKLEAIKIDNEMMGHGSKRLELTGKDGGPILSETSIPELDPARIDYWTNRIRDVRKKRKDDGEAE